MTHQNIFQRKHYLHPRAIFHPAPCKRKSQLHTNNKKTTSGVLFSQLMWGDKRKRSPRTACDAYFREDLSTSITLWTSFSECVCGLGRLSTVLKKRICSPDTNPHNIQMLLKPTKRQKTEWAAPWIATPQNFKKISKSARLPEVTDATIVSR
jgi:hypothetical protein